MIHFEAVSDLSAKLRESAAFSLERASHVRWQAGVLAVGGSSVMEGHWAASLRVMAATTGCAGSVVRTNSDAWPSRN
jgi:hypothetical protein